MKRVIEISMAILLSKAIYELFENFMGFKREE